METILLGFCLISLMITGLIVVVEVLRERKRFSKLSDVVELRQELGSLSKENFQVVGEESQPQISQRVFDVLRQQLRIFGYRSEEQQMLFLNRLLGSDHKVLSDLSPQELRQVFAEIHPAIVSFTPWSLLLLCCFKAVAFIIAMFPELTGANHCYVVSEPWPSSLLLFLEFPWAHHCMMDGFNA